MEFKPNESLSDNHQELITETLTTVFLLLYLMMTDLQIDNENIKEICGWILVGILFLALAISLKTIMVSMFASAK